MRNKVRSLINLVVVVLAFTVALSQHTPKVAFAASPTATGTVRINEVMWAGSYSGASYNSSDQWIELYNTTSQVVDLSNWSLSTTGSSPVTVTIPANTMIPAYGYFLISHYGVGSNSVLNVTPELITPTVSQLLPTSCQQIQLLDASANVVDTMGCNADGSYLAGQNNNTFDTAASMARLTPYNDGAVATSWQTTNSSKNILLSAESQNFGTPDFFNGIDTTAPIDGTIQASGLGNNQIIANWNNFYDPETGISNYLVGLGSQSTVPDLLPYVSVGSSTSDVLNVANFSPTSQYYVFIEAQNGVGLISIPVTTQVLSPNLNQNLVTINQNPPGTADTVAGQAGASSDPNATVTVYANNPTNNRSPILIASELANSNGSFNPIDIGDNQYSNVWVELSDIAGTSNVLDLTNQIIPPSAPTLTLISAVCSTTNCQVTLNWQDSTPEVAEFIINYTSSNSIEHTPLLTGSSTVLSLSSDKTYVFSIQAIDNAGNLSLASNALTINLVPNATIVTTASGSQVTPTKKAVIVSAAQVIYAPPASAPATTPTAITSNTASGGSTNANNSNSSGSTSTSASSGSSGSSFRYWVQGVVTVILLILAGGFFFIARSISKINSQPKSTKTKNSENKSGEKYTATNLKRGRGRPKGSTDKSRTPKR